MNPAIERRYRRVLRWYPRSWRERHGDVMISTLFEVAAAEGRREPRRRDLANLAIAGLAARLGVFLPSSARDVISTAALGFGSVLAVVFFLVHTWSPWAPLDEFAAAVYPSFGPFVNPGVVLYGIWVVALVLGVLGSHRALRFTMIAAFFAPLGLRLANYLQGDVWLGPTATTLGVFTMLALIVLCGTPRRPSGIAISALVASVGSVVVYGAQLTQGRYVDDRWFWSEMAWSYTTAMVVLVGISISIGLGIARRGGTAILVLASTAPWLAIWCIGALKADPWNTLGLTSILLIGVAVVLGGRLAIQRSRGVLQSNPTSARR